MIQSPLLPSIRGYINGRWTGADSGHTIPVINPATGDQLADVPETGEAETRRAIDAAALTLASETTIDERSRRLELIAHLIAQNKNELARIITLEQGKPLKESVVEADYAAGFFRFYSQQVHHLEPQALEEEIRGCRWTVYHRPTGVAALITPWNFPIALLAKKLSAAIAAGCAVVAKPAEKTPLTAIALWGLMEGLQAPPGQFNLVIGHAAPIGDVFCAYPAVRLISFTGSTEVGKLLAEKTAPHLKRLALELGGNAPFIVFDDADIESAAAALIANKFRCAGQTCVCTNRVYVHQRIAGPFVEAVRERASKLKVGNGMDPDTDIGPLINRAGFDKVSRHVNDALSQGAERVLGTDPPAPPGEWGCFYPPTILTNVTPQMLPFREETFGPVIAVATFESEDDAIAQANGTPYGLASYLFTRDPERAQRVRTALCFGHVGINTGAGPTPEAPFGGMKESGYGREGGLDGLFEFCETQTSPRGHNV